MPFVHLCLVQVEMVKTLHPVDKSNLISTGVFLEMVLRTSLAIFSWTKHYFAFYKFLKFKSAGAL